MRTTDYTTQFKRDFKREKRSGQHGSLDELLREVFEALAHDKPLTEKHRDQELVGSWQDHRECHVKPDLLLIYRKLDDHILQLVRLGSHNELFS